MKWTVAYRRSARNDLAALWVSAGDRAAVTAAANQIDVMLANDPLGVGESRDNGRRILIEIPLAVVYRLKPADNKVVVLRVWRYSK